MWFNSELDSVACSLCTHRFHYRHCWSYLLFIDPARQEMRVCICEGYGDQVWRKVKHERP